MYRIMYAIVAYKFRL